MTAFYVRIKRGDKFEALEIDQLTDEELEKFFTGLAGADRWAIALAKWIRDNVK